MNQFKRTHFIQTIQSSFKVEYQITISATKEAILTNSEELPVEAVKIRTGNGVQVVTMLPVADSNFCVLTVTEHNLNEFVGYVISVVHQSHVRILTREDPEL